MATIVYQADLKAYNTLALPCVAKCLVDIYSAEELQEVYQDLELSPDKALILGGGSNLVLPAYLDKTVLRLKNQGIKYSKLSADQVLVDVEAGVPWDKLVQESVDKRLHGLENLSLIPGTVGAAPVQNIGAYGVELADVLESVRVFNSQTKQFEVLSNDDCQFAYRDSLFKRHPGCYCILNVRLCLSTSKPFNLNYGELKTLQERAGLSASEVRHKVIEVRRAKLPDPDSLPNAGSFFKNPIVSAEKAAVLKAKFPDLVCYPVDNGHVKLAAGWLIDSAGWKGHRNADVGVHEKQALVLINHSHAKQSDLLELVQQIQCSIKAVFNVSLEVEPIVLPNTHPPQ